MLIIDTHMTKTFNFYVGIIDKNRELQSRNSRWKEYEKYFWNIRKGFLYHIISCNKVLINFFKCSLSLKKLETLQFIKC